MGSEVIIMPIICATVFGIAYLFYSSRNKERLALIERGENASIFLKGKDYVAPVWKVILLNLAILCIGIGTGIFIANALVEALALDKGVVYTGTVFIVSGLSLLIGFFVSKKVVEK